MPSILHGTRLHSVCTFASTPAPRSQDTAKLQSVRHKTGELAKPVTARVLVLLQRPTKPIACWQTRSPGFL
jgi:hypothetical protein